MRLAPSVKRPGSPVLFAIVMVTVFAIGWTTDHNSCLRSLVTRRQQAEIVRTLEQVTHTRLPAVYSHARLPSCDKALPDR